MPISATILLILASAQIAPGGGGKAPETWWSLRPLPQPTVPTVQNPAWVRTPIDAFILKQLEVKGLAPNPEADRRTLIRRLSYDLIGLPPAPAEIEAFVNDPAPDAYERLAERLLASAHYGERWGRHWLDVVHYGDTHGYDKDKRRPHAWPFRDYVIRSLNADKPYVQFLSEQLAGDVLLPDDPEGIIATGFIAAGPWDFVGHVELREGTLEKEKTRVLDRDDMVASTIGTFMSLTIHCARCHDHKFDPITQQDYYRLQAVFAGTERGDRSLEAPALAEQRRALTALQKEAQTAREELHKKIAALPASEVASAELKLRLKKETETLAWVEKDLKSLPPQQLVYTIVPRAPRPVHVLRRGDVEQPKALMTPGGIASVPGLEGNFAIPKPDDEGARRVALAEWIAHPHNPLTWRSIVNRVWHYHFGRGLVDTPNDFGRNGSQPTHPELLDWLAVSFRDGGGSLKELHRLIVISSVYRQASTHHPAHAKMDGDNRLLWRMNRQRLDAESVRDAVLTASGQLDRRMGGPGYDLFRFRDDHSPEYDHTALERIHDRATYRRTVYRFVVRSVPNPFLDCLDCADPNVNTPVRSTTLTALQALALLNDPFMVRQAELLAARLNTLSKDPQEQIEAAYRLMLGRPPRPEERAALLEHVQSHGLANACRVLFNSNEFVFVD